MNQVILPAYTVFLKKEKIKEALAGNPNINPQFRIMEYLFFRTRRVKMQILYISFTHKKQASSHISKRVIISHII